MSAVEDFLAKQPRFECERLSAVLTLAQCEANRTRQPNLQKGINIVMACEGCAGLGKAVEIKERVMATHKECSECHKVKKIHSHGQCAQCLYKKYGKAMRPPKDEAAVAAGPEKTLKQPAAASPAPPKHNPLLPPPISSDQIVLDFTGHAELFSWLKEAEVTPDHIIELLGECYRRAV